MLPASKGFVACGMNVSIFVVMFVFTCQVAFQVLQTCSSGYIVIHECSYVIQFVTNNAVRGQAFSPLTAHRATWFVRITHRSEFWTDTTHNRTGRKHTCTEYCIQMQQLLLVIVQCTP